MASGELYAAVDVDAVFIPIMQHRYFDTLHVAGSIADLPAVVTIGVRIDQPLLISIINKSLDSLTARETDQMMAQWVDANSYGPPALSELLDYYLRELLVLVLFLIIFAYLLYRAHQAQRQARRSERDKAMLLAVMSHEIRTPMNAILSSVELLGRARLQPRMPSWRALPSPVPTRCWSCLMGCWTFPSSKPNTCNSNTGRPISEP